MSTKELLEKVNVSPSLPGETAPEDLLIKQILECYSCFPLTLFYGGQTGAATSYGVR